MAPPQAEDEKSNLAEESPVENCGNLAKTPVQQPAETLVVAGNGSGNFLER